MVAAAAAGLGYLSNCVSGALPPVRGRLARERLSWEKGRPGPHLGAREGSWRSLARTGGLENPPGYGHPAAASNRLFRDKPGAGAGPGFAGGRAARGGPAGEHAPASLGPAPRCPPARQGAAVPGLAGARPPAEPGHRRLPGHGTGRGCRPRPRRPGIPKPQAPAGACESHVLPSLCCSPLLGGVRPGAPLFSLFSLPYSPAGGRSRLPAPSRRGVAGCGADSGPAATQSKLSGSGRSRSGAQAAATPADPLLHRRRRPSSRAQTWSI